MTTDPVHILLEHAHELTRHYMRREAAEILRIAHNVAGEHAWTVQDLRDAWTSLKAQG